MRPASTRKHLKEGIIRLFAKEKFSRSLHVENTSGSTVDKKQAVVKASLQKRKGTYAWAKRVRPVSTI
jgi:hypothetical protein